MASQLQTVFRAKPMLKEATRQYFANALCSRTFFLPCVVVSKYSWEIITLYQMKQSLHTILICHKLWMLAETLKVKIGTQIHWIWNYILQLVFFTVKCTISSMSSYKNCKPNNYFSRIFFSTLICYVSKYIKYIIGIAD